MSGNVPNKHASAQVRHLRLVDRVPVDQGVGETAGARTEGGSPRSSVSRATTAPIGRGMTTNAHLFQPSTDRPWEDPDSLLGRWSTSMTGTGCSERTVREWVQIVTRAARHAAKEPETLDAQSIERWLASLTGRNGAAVRPGTKAAYIVALRAWHVWLVRNDLRPDNPVDRLGRVRVPRREPRPTTTRDLEILLESQMRPRTRVMLHLAIYQGLRVHEIAKVRGEDFDLVNGQLTVMGKGGVEVNLELHEVVARDARAMPRRGWWFPSATGDGHIRRDSVSTVIAQAMRRAGVRGTAHQLRHYFATTLVEEEVHVRVVQVAMRHGSLQTTAGYARVSRAQLRDAMDRFPTIREHRIA